MYQLSCDISYFASKNLQEGLLAADALHINNIELFHFEGFPLEACTAGQVEDIRNALIDHNKTIVLLTTSLPVTDAAAFNELLRMAELWNIGIVFENDHNTFFCDNPSMSSFLTPLPEHAGLAFNPSEFVALAKHPFFHVFYASNLKNRVRFLRLNDTLYSTGAPTALAGGNCEIKELISILLSRSYEGYFSIAPYRHLSVDSMQQTLNEYRTLLKNL